jgi:hypothetical protein
MNGITEGQRVRLAEGRVYVAPSGRLCMWERQARGSTAPWLSFRYVDGGGFYLTRANLHVLREAYR